MGYLWLTVRAWRLSVWWGLAVLLFFPSAIILVATNYRKVAGPSVTILIGVVLVCATVGLNLLLTHELDLGPRERIVDGELHITLTGWDQPTEDYAVLASKPDTVVLQMANADVTDETLQYLQPLDLLQELDLNDTLVTDGGLARLAQLTRLRVLRIRGTRVTDEGFRQYLLNKDSLEELDVRNTTVASKTLRQWKSAKGDVRRYLK
jgi:hypothetical protein